MKGRRWIDTEQERRHPRLDIFGEERKKCDAGLLSAEQMLSCITKISINGADLIHFDEDVSLSKIYRYLDKLSDNQHKTSRFLFRGLESLQGIGASAETVRHKYECGQGARTC